MKSGKLLPVQMISIGSGRIPCLSRAEEWQRAEAWATWERMKAGDVREASKAEIDREFEQALQQTR